MLELRERVQAAADALDRLTPTARAAFLMHGLDGVGYATVARSLGVSVSMVEKHIMSALATIRQAR
jgi:RNA polymerase sigma-70 factor (ECF subfamily)